MLKHRLIHPKINEILGRAGHHAKVLIADGNYPASSTLGPRAEQVSLNLMPGVVNCTQVLEAVLSAIPVERANTMMYEKTGPYALVEDPPVWAEYRRVMRDAGLKLELGQSDRDELESRARSRVVRAEDARRARLILLLADGEPYTTIQSKLRCNRSYVSRWKARFLEGGIASLYARQQGRKRSVLTPAMEARVLKWTSRKPTDGSTHWTTRKLASKLGIPSPAHNG